VGDFKALYRQNGKSYKKTSAAKGTPLYLQLWNGMHKSNGKRMP